MSGDNVIEEKLFDFIYPFREKIYKKIKKVWSFFQTTHVINPQYLINDESDQKSVTNKKDATFHFISEVCHQI